MSRMLERWRKAIALALLVSNLCGGRMVTVTHACERAYSYFLPSVAVDAIQKSLIAEPKSKSFHSFGRRQTRTSHDLDSLRNDAPSHAAVVQLASAMVAVADRPGRASLHRLESVTNKDPIPPPLPLSKK